MASLDKQDKTAIASYLGMLRQFPQLKHPEVVELFKTYESGGEAADLARRKLTECNLRLVVSIAKQYKGHNIPMEDLIQEGNIGLMKAIERFDWKKGFKFSTYSTWWIKQAIGQHVLKRKRMIRLPAHAAAVQRKLIKAAQEYKDATGVEATPEELMEIIGASETVVNATIHSGKGTVSLQQQTSSNIEGDTLADHIQDEREGVSPFENVAQQQLLMIVRNVVASLSPKEAAILRLRFGLYEDETDSERYPITQAELESIEMGKPLE